MLTDEQMLQRRRGIGGSDVAAIAGLSPYKTPLQVYLEKLELAEHSGMTPSQRWGHIMEPVILDEYEREKEVILIRSPATIVSTEYPWMFANVDASAFNGALIVDAKNIDSHSKWQWGNPGTSEMPDYILLQMIHYAIVCNADWVDVAVLFGKCDFNIYTYSRDKELEKEIIDMEREFWHENVLKEIPPTVQSVADATALWKNARKESIHTADEGSILAWQKLMETKKLLKDLEKEEERLKTTLQIAMQDNEKLADDSGSVLATWKNQTTNRFDQTAFKNDYPQLYDTYKKEFVSRVFRINEKGL